MMYAVVETSGKQYQAQEGKYIDVDLLNQEPESEVTLESVVAIIAGEKSQIGQPYIEGATIKAKILKHGKAKKVIAYKMRKKKGYRVKQGHRQDFTRILVEEIDFPEKTETLKYVKQVEEKLENELKAEEEKLQKAKEKKQAQKAAKKAKKAESKEKETAKKQKTTKTKETKTEKAVVEETSVDEVTQVELSTDAAEETKVQEAVEVEQEATAEVSEETQDQDKE